MNYVILSINTYILRGVFVLVFMHKFYFSIFAYIISLFIVS